MTTYAEADDKDWTRQKKFTKVDAFLGETCLNQEMNRNGWAMAHHTGRAFWESIARENGGVIEPGSPLIGFRSCSLVSAARHRFRR